MDEVSPPLPLRTSRSPDMTGVVLAGGASRRMGTDKAVIVVDGETLLQRAARHLVEAGADPVVLATGTAGRLGPLPYDEADDGDRHRGEGPLAGLLAALRHPTTTDVVAGLAVDLPHASPTLLRWLREEWRPGRDLALVPLDAGGRPQPLHALYARDPTAATIERQLIHRRDRRVLGLISALDARTVIPPATVPAGWWANWNTPHPGWVGQQ
ncbi:MAG TPA: molybdenum cofactor guanylyltransferase [Acidimicrobiales bacterium]|nr:molybdenum cofactor guanylyltransferase [Acidimicrobiales bacterium]